MAEFVSCCCISECNIEQGGRGSMCILMTKRVVQEMGEDSMVCQEKCESMRLFIS
jgi:hypothetical protein